MASENDDHKEGKWQRIMVIGELEKARQLADSFEELNKNQQIINNQINVAVLTVPDYSTAEDLSILSNEYLAVVSFNAAELRSTKTAINRILKTKPQPLDDNARYYLAKNDPENILFLSQDQNGEEEKIGIDDLKEELKKAMLENIYEE